MPGTRIARSHSRQRPRRLPARLRLATCAAVAAALMAGCGGSGEMSQDDFVRVLNEADLEATVEPRVLDRYAECLYEATDGNVAEFVEHLGDSDYQPTPAAEEALATCSDVLGG